MTENLTCIVCPMGCQIEAEVENKTVISVKGASCARGENYAKTELTNPMRVITTTIRSKSGELVPVKTDKAVPKESIFQCIHTINTLHPPLSQCFIGAVIEENLLNMGVNVLVTAPANRS